VIYQLTRFVSFPVTSKQFETSEYCLDCPDSE